MSLRIGIDMDGVVANFTDTFTEVLTRQTGKKFPVLSREWPTTWNWDKDLTTPSERSAAWEYVKTTHFWAQLAPLEGTLHLMLELNALRNAGHHIYFITSRPGNNAKYYSEMWLQLHGAHNPTVLMSFEKGFIARGLSLDIFIDDKVENIEDVLFESPSTDCYIIDWAYNRHFTDPRVDRVKTVQEVLDMEFGPKAREAA